MPRTTTILFDVFELAPGTGKSIGIYHYARNLLREMLTTLEPGMHVVVACNGRSAPDFDVGIHPQATLLQLCDGVPSKVQRVLWSLGGARRAMRRAGARVYFSPKGFLPYGLGRGLGLGAGARSVVVIHDLIPLWYARHHPGYFGGLEEAYINRELARSAKHADRVIAISSATANDIRSTVGREGRLDIVPNGLPPLLDGPAPMAGGYIFAVASALPHKNAVGVLAAYQRYRQAAAAPLPLLICGIDDPHQSGVTAVRNLSDEQLHGCYQHAKAFLFLSLIEGFGFPPLEAMGHGVPVVCSDIPSLREVVRGAALLVPPDDAAAAAQALQLVLADGADTAARIQQGRAVAAGYTWLACSRSVMRVLREESAQAQSPRPLFSA